MHSSTKRKANPPSAEDWCCCYNCGCAPCYCYYDDWDDCHNCCCLGCVAGNCSCLDEKPTPHHRIVAKAYADRIIADVALNDGIRDFIIRERLDIYGYDHSGHGNRQFKEDLVFAWKMIKDTPEGVAIFASIFGAKE